MEKEQNQKSIFQITSSSFVMITGLFIILSMANNITGRAIGNAGDMNLVDIIIVFWGSLILIAGIWMWYRNDFHESIFEK